MVVFKTLLVEAKIGYRIFWFYSVFHSTRISFSYILYVYLLIECCCLTMNGWLNHTLVFLFGVEAIISTRKKVFPSTFGIPHLQNLDYELSTFRK